MCLNTVFLISVELQLEFNCKNHAVLPSVQLARYNDCRTPHWASDDNLRLNQNKTFEIIFSARGNRGTLAVLPPTLPNIQRVTNIKALGINITSQISMNLHVDTLVESCVRTLYGLRVLRAHGMSDDCIQEVFRRPRNRSSRPLTIDPRQISINSIDRLDRLYT